MRRAVALAAAGSITLWACTGRDEPGPRAPVDAGPRAVAAAPHPKPPLGFEVAAVSGEAHLVRGGAGSRPVEKGALEEGDVLTTGGAAGVEVHMLDGSVVQLGARGRYVFEQRNGALVVRIEQGVLVSKTVDGSGAAGLEVQTPFGLTRVGKSELVVTVGEASDAIDVSVGSATLVDRSGGELLVSTGEAAMLTGAGVEGEAGLPELALLVDGAGGRAELKRAGANRFTALAPQKKAPLASGDTVRVQAGEAAIVSAAAGGSRVVLEKGAVVGFGGARAAGEKGRWSVPLVQGTVTVSAGEAGPLLLDVGKGLKLDAAEGSRYEATRTAEGVEIVPSMGNVKLEPGGATVGVVEAGKRALVTPKGITVLEIERSSVSLPSRPGLKVFHPGLATFTIAWDATGGPPWRLRVGSDEALLHLVFDGSLSRPFHTLQAPARGVLFWAVEREGARAARGSARFAPEPRSAELSSVRNEVPEGTEKTTIFFQDKPPALTFTWVPPEGAASSKVSVFREGELGKPVVEKTVAAATLALPALALTEGRYSWSVTPLDQRGQPLRGGRMSKLEITYDNGQEALLISSPKNSDPPTAKVAVRGVAPVGSRLFVNEVPVALDEQARFEAQVAPLAGGRVVFHLQRAGTESYTVRQLRKAR